MTTLRIIDGATYVLCGNHETGRYRLRIIDGHWAIEWEDTGICRDCRIERTVRFA